VFLFLWLHFSHRTRELQHHRTFQAAFRKFFDEVIWPDARLREEDGKRPDLKVMRQMAELNVIAVRLGPGPHLKGRTILGGAVKPEEVCVCVFRVGLLGHLHNNLVFDKG
jgi:hypothetical protein